MIEQFNDVEMRNSGVIYNSTFNQIKQLYEMDSALAGELAISAIELVLTGGISSDDPMISLMLEPMKKINQSNNIKYDNKVETNRQKRINELELDKVANMMIQGYTQKQIGEMLKMSQQNVSYRQNVIRTKFPELLQTNHVCTNNLQTVQTDRLQNVCTNILQTVQIDTKESVCMSDPVCRNDQKIGKSKQKLNEEEKGKVAFRF